MKRSADLDDVDDPVEWTPVTRPAAIALTAFAAWIIWGHFFSQGHWLLLLDNANLALHEAGHPLVGIFSYRLMVYGGTLFQLLFPALFMCHFHRQGQRTGWIAALMWLGESLMNVAHYMTRAPRCCRWWAAATMTGRRSSAAGACSRPMCASAR
jgi:hypothetical protein